VLCIFFQGVSLGIGSGRVADGAQMGWGGVTLGQKGKSPTTESQSCATRPSPVPKDGHSENQS